MFNTYGLVILLVQIKSSANKILFLANVNSSGELLIQTWTHIDLFTGAFNGLFTGNVEKYAKFDIPVEVEGDFNVLKTQEIKVKVFYFFSK